MLRPSISKSSLRFKRPSGVRLGAGISLLSIFGVWSCGYIGLDTQDGVNLDLLMPDGSGGGTGGLQQGLPSGGQFGTGATDNTGGVDTGGMPGVGGFAWGGFGGLGGYGGASDQCETGEICDFSCRQSPCRVDCPPDSSCEIESDGVPTVITRCGEGALCHTTGAAVPSVVYVCQGPGDCEFHCSGAAQCSAHCVGSGNCALACEGSDCSVQCGSMSQCMMLGGGADKHICAGTKKYCANGVTTCNRDCP